ncbi:MAG: D-glycero-beta-D-manno-heptose 1,7-bisphosphate 7-phosphatase [Gammaproteobacteria bacterium]
MSACPLLILDRDGVINEESNTFIKEPQEWHPIPGSLKAIASAHRQGFRIVVVTNQSGLGRGVLNIDALNRIHEEMHRQVIAAGGVIDAIFFCPHTPEDCCPCRKPNPGLYLELAKRLGVSLRGVSAIGDRASDIEAAQRAGAAPRLVKTGRGCETLASEFDLNKVPVYPDLAAAVRELVGESR